jgi:Domain of unknown function (DUF4926)/Domain of unknown function (DUF6883)
LLNAAHPDNGGKAAFFEALGFRREEPQTLAKAMLDLARRAEVTKSAASPHGRKYIVIGQIKSPRGRTANVRTIWIIDKGMRYGKIGYRLSAQSMKGEIIKEHDRVVLKVDLPAEGLKAGDVGTVVHLYRDGLAYEVEFTTLSGDTAAVVTVQKSQVRSVRKREITHARELQAA